MAVTTTNLGVITAYGDAVAAGYTGTKAEWQALMASYATVGQQAVDAKNAAVAAKDTAVSKATEATTAANTATTKANEASASAQSIAQSASQIAQNTSDISELKEDLTTLAQKDDMLKAFPTDTTSGIVASFADGANVPVKSLIVNIDPVQSGSGDPSPDNVRPISGWSEVNVLRAGKNLFDEANATIYKRYFQAVTGEYIWSPISDSSSYAFKCQPNTTYTLKPNNPNVNIFRVATINVSIEESENATLNQVSTTEIPRTITTDADATYIVIQANNSIASAKATQLQIELGESATEFEPYQSIQSVNIPLGQTVYGGKLDVVSGVLTVDNGYKNKDNVRKEVYTLNGNNVWLMEYETASIGSAEVSAISSVLKQGSYNGIYEGQSNIVAQNSQGRLLANVDGISSVSDIDTWLNANPDFLVVYKLATPITVQLTPHEVTALLGSNNVWADTGDTEVTYRADPTLYIGRLTEPDADMVADANITSGSYFMVGNTLYKATVNIASGATISPNVNCTRKSLSEALNELNA